MVNKVLKRWKFNVLAAAMVVLWPAMGLAADHGIAMHGALKFALSFDGVDFVNPNAPKGGALRLSVVGSFDSLNPFIIKGAPAFGPMVGYNRYLKNLVYETLLKRSPDEPFTLYGLLAETVEMADDRRWVRFTLNPAARFSDGTPVTVEDVLFSWRTLKDYGRPNHRLYYGMVAKAEKTGEREITFTFKTPGGRVNAELPLIIGLMPVLPAHYFSDHPFERTGLVPIPGSGPYVIDRVEAGRRVTFRRDPGYWGKALPVNRGLYNFDQVSVDYYRDATAEMEAFKAGLIDFRQESDPTRWQQLKALAGIETAEIANGWPAPMRGMVFNTRRAIFADARVRQALGLTLDFEWINDNFFHDAYVRTNSWLDGSELAAHGQAQGPVAEALKAVGADDPLYLAPPAPPPAAPDAAALRRNLRQADALLRKAGWRVRDGRLVDAGSGRPFTFEILIANASDERIALHFARNLLRLGIEATVHTVDSATYQARLDEYDFDMIIYRWDLSLSPGNELAFYFGSNAARTPGTRNYMGVESPAIDGLIHRIVSAQSRQGLVAATQALDRVLWAGHYVIPLYHAPAEWLAYRPRLARPEKAPQEGYLLEAWWSTAP
jgi:ABC-type oligopeptide transport system substrate-binding subunit